MPTGPSTSRWRRRARGAGALLVVGAVAVLVPLAPRWVDASRPASGSSDPAVLEASTDCRSRATGELDHGSFLVGEAAWVRFCAVGASYPRRRIGAALVPTTVLAEDAATLVRGWQRTEAAGDAVAGPCRPTASATTFAVQVGFEDGTVAEVYGETSECPAFTRPGPTVRVVAGGRVYRDLMTALATRPDGSGASPTGTPSCPDAPPALPRTVTARPATGLTATGVAEAVLCRYDGPGAVPVVTDLRPSQAERVRVLALGAFDPTPPACTPDAGAPSYVVVLAGRDGRVYDLGLDESACDALRIDDQRTGSSRALARTLAELSAP